MKRTSFILLLLVMCGALNGQEKYDSTDLYFHHLRLNEIVITGVAGDSRLQESSTPVSVLLPEELISTASTNIINAIARQAGVSEITTGSGISKPVIRGLGYNRVLVVQDGIRQEEQQWGDEHGIGIDGCSVHSVEILRGPASLMYGSDALAGVLIFHPDPVAPAGTVRGSFQSEYQSNNGLAAYSLAVGGNTGRFHWDLRYSDKYAHAYRNRYDGYVANSQFAERAVKGRAGSSGDWGFSHLTFSYYQLKPGIVEGERDPQNGELEGLTGYAPGLPFQMIRHYKAVWDNTFRVGERGRIKALLGWQQNRRQEFEESAEESGLDFRLNTLNYDLKYQLEGLDGWKMASGAGGMYQQSDNLGDEYLIPAYHLFDAGVFASVSKSWQDWTLSGGLRGDIRALSSQALEDRFKAFDRRYTGLTGSLGAVWRAAPGLDIRVNAARGFRAPNLSELGSNGEHEGTFRYEMGNADLKPEFSLQGDFGIDYSSRYFSAQLSLFANRIDNYIYTARNGEFAEEELPIYVYQQGNAILKGLEAGVDIHPVHALHLGSTFSYVSGKRMDGTWLPMIPAPRLLSEIKYEITHDGRTLNNSYVCFSVDWNWAQNHFYGLDDTETATPAYTLLGFSAGTDLMIRGKKRAGLYLIVDNLTDVAWQNHLSRLKYADENPLTHRTGIYGIGRNIVVKLQIPF